MSAMVKNATLELISMGITMRVKVLLIILAAVVGLLLVTEALLRLILGLGNPPLYLADEEIGYLLAPQQQVSRLGKKMIINEYSMRTKSITPQKSPQTLRIFLLGDSVANGAWWTDQGEIISQLIENQLAVTGQQLEVLNASANSWGPRNQLAYLQKYGTFTSETIILLINTDDLFATAPTSLPVGRSLAYPSSKPPLALIEAFQRYVVREKEIPGMAEVQSEKGDRVGFNLAAIKEINRISQENKAQFILAITPLLREIGKPGSRDYEIKARQRLVEFTNSEGISYVDFLPLFAATEQPEALFRDHIHLSPKGNQLVSDTLSGSVKW